MKYIRKKLKEYLLSRLSSFGFKRGKIKNFRLLGMGESNINYFFKINSKEFLLRVSLKEKNGLKREYDFLKNIESKKIAPKPILYHKKDKQINFDFLVLSYIEGKTLKKKLTNQQIDLFAETLAKMHNITLKTDYNDYFETLKWSKIFVKKINVFTKNKYKRKLDFVLKSFDELIKNKKYYILKSLVHSDLTPENVLFHNNKIYFIDWESVSYGDPAKDLATIFINFNMTKEQKQRFLTKYLKKRKHKNIGSITVFTQITLLNYVLWSLLRAYEIIFKKLDNRYLKKNKPSVFIKNARKEMKKLLSL